MKPRYTLIIPAFNEEQAIGKAVEATAKAVGPGCEILVAEDGSTDRTYFKALSACKKHHNARVIHAPRRLGRGKAICNAIRIARGRVVAFIDADLSPGTQAITPVLKQAEKHGMAIGSRYLAKSSVKRGVDRKIASTCYNRLARLLLGTTVSDHQCGLKAFRKELGAKLCSECAEEGWSWDTEMIALAAKHGIAVAETPVNWKERTAGASKVSLAKDSLEMLLELLKIAFRPRN
jgi:glycosyltransferase involved in cell wall biosynthesis